MDDLQEFTKSLPEDRQARIEAGYQKIRAEHLTLQELRKKRKITQNDMSKLLNITQSQVSRLEGRNDWLVSSLASYADALGAKMEIVFTFPDEQVINITPSLDKT